MLRIAKWLTMAFAGVVAISWLGIGVWTRTLPHLDPTGRIDSAGALRAMIDGHTVYLVDGCPWYKPWKCMLTKDDYEQPEGDRK